MRRIAMVALLAAIVGAAQTAAASSPPLGHIAYSERYFPKNAGDSWEIFVMNADGSGSHDVSNSPSCDDGGPAISPDGLRIAAVCDSLYDPHPAILSVMNLDGSDVRRILTTPNYHHELSGPAWSPDGRLLAVTYEHYLTTVDLTSGRLRRLVRAGGSPTWSPDGAWIAFNRTSRGGGISIVGSDGRHLHSLTPADSWFPQWSPDGRTIMFGSSAGTILMHPDGSGRRVIAADTDGKTWSPDGRRILYTTEAGVFVMNRDGSHRRRIIRAWDVAGASWGR